MFPCEIASTLHLILVLNCATYGVQFIVSAVDKVACEIASIVTSLSFRRRIPV